MFFSPVGLSTICNEFGLEANPFKKFNEGIYN